MKLKEAKEASEVPDMNDFFNEMQSNIADELEIDEFTAVEELKKVQKKWHYWHSMFIAKKNEMDEASDKMEEVAHDITFQIKTGRHQLSVSNRAELDAIINQNEDYKSYKYKKQNLSSEVEYLKGVVKIFEQRIWVIRALIDYEQKRG